MKKYLFMALWLGFYSAKAQNCPYFPADCPDNGNIQAAMSAGKRSGNGLSDKEILMQDQMRNLTSDMMVHIAKTLGWHVIEISEAVGKQPFQSKKTPESLKSPRPYGIEFEFIVNKDSLQAWKDWRIDFANRSNNALSNYTSNQTDIVNSSLYKQYSDSVDKYFKLWSDYGTAHQNDGLALLEDKKMKGFRAKQDEYLNKRAALLNANNAQSNFTSLDAEMEQRTIQFRDASMVEIFIQCNDPDGIIYSSTGTGGERVTDINLLGTSHAKFVYLPNADLNSIPWHFDQWNNMAVLLLGKWLPGLNQFKAYSAEFTLNGQFDEHTPKKIMSDKVQTIALHILGSKANINKLMGQIDLNKLNDAIYKAQ